MSKIFKLGVIGNPIEHSLSPFIHSRFGSNEGLNLDYKAYRVEQGAFDGFISEFFSDKYAKGLNVTLPLKNLAATNIKGNISNEAKFINAVNTIIKKDKQFFLESTDGSGFIDDLHKKSINPEGKKILILGAGSAVESILYKLYNSRPEHITIVNRTKEKAESLCANYKNPEVVTTSMKDSKYDLIVNGSSAGLTGEFSGPSNISVSESAVFYDLNYSLAKTPFGEWAEEYSNQVYDGIGMLVNQAALSFNHWFGSIPETNSVIKDIEGLSKWKKWSNS